MIYKNLDYKLSKNFRLGEFAVSESYPELAKKIEFTYLDVLNLELLCLRVLQPIREKFGPLEILSGKRPQELNAALGGAPKSNHLTSTAADIRIISFAPVHIFKWVVMESVLPYGQAIYYPDQKFIHLSINQPWDEVQHEAWVKNGGTYQTYEKHFKEYPE